MVDATECQKSVVNWLLQQLEVPARMPSTRYSIEPRFEEVRSTASPPMINCSNDKLIADISSSYSIFDTFLQLIISLRSASKSG